MLLRNQHIKGSSLKNHLINLKNTLKEVLSKLSSSDTFAALLRINLNKDSIEKNEKL